MIELTLSSSQLQFTQFLLERFGIEGNMLTVEEARAATRCGSAWNGVVHVWKKRCPLEPAKGKTAVTKKNSWRKEEERGREIKRKQKNEPSKRTALGKEEETKNPRTEGFRGGSNRGRAAQKADV